MAWKKVAYIKWFLLGCKASDLPCELHSSSFTLRGWKYVCFTHGLVLGCERGRLTAHLWAANEGVTHKKRRWRGAEGEGGVGREGSLALQTTSVLTWVPLFGTPTLAALDWNSYTRQEPPPPHPPPTLFSPQRSAHTEGHSKRINTKSMGIRWKKRPKRREKDGAGREKERNLLSNII